MKVKIDGNYVDFKENVTIEVEQGGTIRLVTFSDEGISFNQIEDGKEVFKDQVTYDELLSDRNDGEAFFNDKG